MNRVILGIERAKAQIKDRLAGGVITEQDVAKLAGELNMDIAELARFQELKNIAMMEGRLTQEEAQTIYSLLGETPDHFNGQPVEVKSILTKIFGELLEKSVRKRA
jgi:hypothetical protein